MLCFPSLLHTTDKHTAGLRLRVVNSISVFLYIVFEVEKSINRSHDGDSSINTGTTRVILVLTNCKAPTFKEIVYGNTIPLTTYFLLVLVLLFTNFIAITILVSDLFISASCKHSIGNHNDSDLALSEFSEMALAKFALVFFLAYLG